MKHLLILTLFLLTACGGGGGSSTQSEPDPQPDPVFTMPEYFTYEVQQVGETQKYQGRGVRNGESIYLMPTTLSNGGYTVTGRLDYTLDEQSKLITTDLKLFGFIGSSILRNVSDVELVHQGATRWIGTFTTQGAEFDMRLEGFNNTAAINNAELINADWDEVLSSFDDEEVLYVEVNEGVVTGYSSSGCNIDGNTQKTRTSVFEIELNLLGCQFEGTVVGAYYIYNTGATDVQYRAYGSVSNDQHGFRIFHDLN